MAHRHFVNGITMVGKDPHGNNEKGAWEGVVADLKRGRTTGFGPDVVEYHPHKLGDTCLAKPHEDEPRPWDYCRSAWLDGNGEVESGPIRTY